MHHHHIYMGQQKLMKTIAGLWIPRVDGLPNKAVSNLKLTSMKLGVISPTCDQIVNHGGLKCGSQADATFLKQRRDVEARMDASVVMER